MNKKLAIILTPIIIAATAFVLVYYFYYRTDAKTALTISEKRWAVENSKNKFDFEIVNDYPIYSLNGEGLIFKFIKDLEQDTGLEFNKIPYLSTSTPRQRFLKTRILSNDEKLTNNDILIFKDNYVALGKDYMRINHIKDMSNLSVGTYTKDKADISYYLKQASNISYKTYDKVEDLYKALDNKEVNIIIVPNIKSLRETIKKGSYHIIYNFTEMNKKLVLTLTDNNTKLNTIVRKYYTRWRKNNFIDAYNEVYLNYYLEQNNVDAKTRAELISKDYVYGYVEKVPYEKIVNNHLAGIAGEYVERMSRLGGLNFKYKKYKNKKELQKAIDKKEIDFYFDYYDYRTSNYKATISPFIEDYVVLGKEKDSHIVTSFESLKGQNLVMLGDDSLYYYFSNNSRSNIKTFKTLNELKGSANNRLIVVDSEVYSYYQNTKFKNFKLLYKDTMMNDYKFMVKNDDGAFYDLFNYIIGTNSYYNYRNAGINHMHETIFDNLTFREVYKAVMLLIFIPLIIGFISYLILKAKKKKKKKEITEKHKYIDVLTSLKNRNYLNFKMSEWEENKVLPQAIVIINLNNVQYVNDNYGHETGDDLIIKAAGILVNTQLENSEIMRIDGNEFLVYLVGYSERQVDAYSKKLAKELKTLPHEFGGAVGYSIIEDKIKTIDDAINEATIAMNENKKEYK